MSDRIISEFYSDNGEKSAVVLTDGYGVYVIEYIVAGKVVANQAFPQYTLNTVEAIAEDYVQAENKRWDVV